MNRLDSRGNDNVLRFLWGTNALFTVTLGILTMKFCAEEIKK